MPTLKQVKRYSYLNWRLFFLWLLLTNITACIQKQTNTSELDALISEIDAIKIPPPLIIPTTLNPPQVATFKLGKGDKIVEQTLIDFVENENVKEVKEVVLFSAETGFYPQKRDTYGEINGYILPNEKDIAELVLEVVFFSQKGKVLEVILDTIVHDSTHVYRHSDIIPFGANSYLDASDAIHSIAYQIKKLKTTSPPSERTKWKHDIKVSWKGTKPNEVNLAFEIRQDASYYSDESDYVYGDYVIGYTNTGKQPIYDLLLKLEWLGKENQVLEEEERYVFPSLAPPLMPNYTYIYDNIYFLDKVKRLEDIAAMRITVLEINLGY